MTKPKFTTRASVFGLIGLVALAPTSAFAQAAPQAGAGAGDEIVVTAQRREEKQVDVPISITALGAAQLQTANVQNLGDIGKITPGLRFDSQAAFVQPSIRGIGTGITTSGGGSNVGIYLDGFYSPNPVAATFQLSKVDSIQVLKGPQGTLFGHNTTGGAILVSTADPSEKTAAEAKVSYGRFNAQKYQGYVTFGLAQGVAMDVEGLYAKGNGFVTNIVNNDNHVGAYKNWTIRTGLKAEIGTVTVLARYIHADMNDPSGQMLNSNTDTSIDITTGKPWGVQTVAVPGTFTTDPDKVAANQKRVTRTKSDVAQLTVKADLGFANFTSYTQYRHENTEQSEDLDQTALPVFQIGLPIIDTTVSQELLLSSKSGPALQWTAGLYFFSNKDTWITRVDPGSFLNNTVPVRLGGSGTTTQSYAAFIDGTYQLSDRFFLTAGVRYAHDTVKDAYWNPSVFAGLDPTSRNYVPSISSNHATPRVVLRYKPDDHSSVYASYTKGYKAAIIDVGGSCQDGPAFKCNPVKPEDINAFEVGYKYSDRMLSFSTSAFYYNYKNLQVSEFLGNAQAFILNAAKSEIYGIDAEVNLKLNPHFSINAGGAWTHGRYKQFGGDKVVDPTGATVTTGAPIYATCPTAACYDYVNTASVLTNVHMQHVPDFTATIAPRFTTGMTDHGEFALSGSLYYTSEFFFSPSGTQFRQPAYATVDLRAQWDDPTHKYMVAVYGTNVTDHRYRTQVQYNGFGIGAQWSAPASWGIEVGAKF
ncbi:MAG: TonB-dependent receptor [Sphingomonadales bacterium]|nr:TonB-dependent receptor [Sphingomonadales bacterium]